MATSYVEKASERASASEWPHFFLARFGDGDCIERFSMPVLAREICVSEYGAIVTQVLEVSPDAPARDVTEEAARLVLDFWVANATDDDLDYPTPPEICTSHLLADEIEAQILAENIDRAEELAHRREISSPEQTGRI